MSRILRVLMTFLMAGLAATVVADIVTVYKWVDGVGQIHYTDLPPRQSDAKVLGVYQQEVGIVGDGESGNGDFGENGSEPPEGEPAAQNSPPPEPPVSEEAMAAAAADTAKAKVEQCKAAQDRYQRYIESRRLFREMPDGKREYLTDQELTEARARARQAVSDYCG